MSLLALSDLTAIRGNGVELITTNVNYGSYIPQRQTLE